MDEDIRTQTDAKPYATNLLTQKEKDWTDIKEAKQRVDANEK